MIKIIFEDEYLIVINKPAGLNSIADGYDSFLPHVRTILETEYGKLWVVHRLDKETSGVMILARSALVHQILNDQFAQREVHKQYLAIVFGVFPPQLANIDPLKINGDRRHRTIVDQRNGKPAQTGFSLITPFPVKASLISASPQTGYTHQIRAHLLSLQFPIVSDPLYYSKESREFSRNLPIKRTALHAQHIIFQHPINHTPMNFEAEIPEDFRATINYLNTKSIH
ncbi:MAG: RluA family pseudouridine synthase [Anaerolineaceae bacterium]